MNGIINVLKPPGMTSHDVVQCIRRITGQKKSGHTGTLDPGAAGVLPVCLGKATRLIPYLPDDKCYRAEVVFGASTTTQDSFGEVIKRSNASGLTRQQVAETLHDFSGELSQIPPMTSAIKQQGKKLYELARAGIEVERKPRKVTIHSIKLEDYFYVDDSPRAIIDICCSAGTYVRTICNDLGTKLGCGAYMNFLLRTRAGLFELEQTHTLEELTALAEQGDTINAIIPMVKSLQHLNFIRVEDGEARAIVHGNPVKIPTKLNGPSYSNGIVIRVEGTTGLLALAKVQFIKDTPEYYLVQPIKVLV